MRASRITLVTVLVLVVAAVAYVALTPGLIDSLRPADTVKDEATINKTVLAFVQEPQTDNYSLARVPGWIDNQSNKKIRSATLLIQLFDGDGNRREKITYEVVNLEPKSRKTFDINAGTIPPDRKATVNVTEIEVVR